MDSKLICEIVQGEKAVTGVEAFLIFSVTAFHLAVVAGRVGTDKLVANPQFGSSGFKECRKLPFAVGKTIGEFKAVICLNTFHFDAMPGIPGSHLFEKIGRRIGGLFRIGGEKPQTRELINSGVLKQTQLRIGNTAARNDFYVYLNPLTGIGHLLVRLGLVGCFGFRLWEQAHFPHDPKKAFGTSGITSLAEPVPEFHHAQIGIAAAHILYQLQFCFGVLVRMAVRTPGLAGQGRNISIPARPPEVDIRPAFVVLPAGTADSIFFRIFLKDRPPFPVSFVW